MVYPGASDSATTSGPTVEAKVIVKLLSQGDDLGRAPGSVEGDGAKTPDPGQPEGENGDALR
jgi:hypothetical protein